VAAAIVRWTMRDDDSSPGVLTGDELSEDVSEARRA
jgi:hypothetical protein